MARLQHPEKGTVVNVSDDQIHQYKGWNRLDGPPSAEPVVNTPPAPAPLTPVLTSDFGSVDAQEPGTQERGVQATGDQAAGPDDADTQGGGQDADRDADRGDGPVDGAAPDAAAGESGVRTARRRRGAAGQQNS